MTVGQGTPWVGISTDRATRTFDGANGNTIVANGDFYLQGLVPAGAAAAPLVLGGAATTNAITVPGNSLVNANVLGAVTLASTSAVFGNSVIGGSLAFQVNPGATLLLNVAGAMGSGTGIASATVQGGGQMTIAAAAAINGNVTLQGGGMLVANQAAGLSGAGSLTFQSGSILDITNAAGGTGAAAHAGRHHDGRGHDHPFGRGQYRHDHPVGRFDYHREDRQPGV